MRPTSDCRTLDLRSAAPRLALFAVLFSGAALASAQQSSLAKVARPRAAQADDKRAPGTPAGMSIPDLSPSALRRSRTARSEGPAGSPLSAKAPGAPAAGAISRAVQPGEDAVLFDQPGDGAVWARGRGYKARFDEQGLAFVPFLGSSVADDHPLALGLASASIGGVELALAPAVPPQRDGARIEYSRGALVERFDLAPAGIEQSFVIDELPAAGDLVLRLDVASDLEALAAAEGLEFRFTDGGVRYGRACAIDARGVRHAAEERLVDGGLEIRVAADELAGAALPLVVDPWISVFGIDTTSADTYYADVAYDAATDRYAFVYTQVYSATDNDVYLIEYTPSGSVVPGSLQAIDFTTSAWYNAKIANNRVASQFLTVAIVWPAGGGIHEIWGRTSAAASVSLGAQIQISPTDGYEKSWPDVGGDASVFAPSYYCVTWTRFFAATDSDIHAQLVTTSGTLQGPLILIDNSGSTLDRYPSISKTDGLDPFQTQAWNIVWERQAATNDEDIHAASLAWDGTTIDASYPLVLGPQSDFAARVSTITDDDGTPRKHIVTWMRDGAQHTVWFALMQGTGMYYLQNLADLEGNASSLDRNGPSIDCDGRQFVLAYAESYNGSTTDYDIFTDTLSLVGYAPHLAETRSVVTSSFGFDFYPNVAAAHAAGGPALTYGIAWTSGDGTTGQGPYDVYGSVWGTRPFATFCFPGVDTLGCPCNNAPAGSGRGCDNSAGSGGAVLDASGSPAADTVVLHASAMLSSATCIFLQGSALASAGAQFGDGVRCVGGQLLRLKVAHASAGAADYPQPGDPSILQRCAVLGAPIQAGSERYYQTYYRDPAPFACASPATFNITNAVQTLW